MSGSTENRAPDASEQPDRQQPVYNLGTARRMLPLLDRIVGELVELSKRQDRLAPEQEDLDRRRRSLGWPERSRRYQVREEAAALSREVEQVQGELDALGVVLLDAAEGRVGLPTIVNGHLAYFSWSPGEPDLRCWHFAGETVRRQIPPGWKDAGDIRLLGKT